jgi:hypothetical protein
MDGAKGNDVRTCGEARNPQHAKRKVRIILIDSSAMGDEEDEEAMFQEAAKTAWVRVFIRLSLPDGQALLNGDCAVLDPGNINQFSCADCPRNRIAVLNGNQPQARSGIRGHRKHCMSDTCRVRGHCPKTLIP